MNQDAYPELINFMGFQEEAEDEIMEGDPAKSIYPEHLPFEELVLGVKQGLYFQGRLNVSRLVQTEATVKIQGLSQDILIQTTLDQNRALNGDIVCIEVLPENLWVRDYKSTEPVNALLDDAQDVEKVVSDSEEEPEAITKNLMVRINEETQRRVTGVVKGVLKKMNKTYGGSLVQKKDMRPATLEKFKLFCSNNDVSEKDQNQYRVFVPYNI
jgi:exosome complex exonuclease DIS3/RRP44